MLPRSATARGPPASPIPPPEPTAWRPCLRRPGWARPRSLAWAWWPPGGPAGTPPGRQSSSCRSARDPYWQGSPPPQAAGPVRVGGPPLPEAERRSGGGGFSGRAPRAARRRPILASSARAASGRGPPPPPPPRRVRPLRSGRQGSAAAAGTARRRGCRPRSITRSPDPLPTSGWLSRAWAEVGAHSLVVVGGWAVRLPSPAARS